MNEKPTPMSEWKPIETAPLLVGRCLLFCPERHERDGRQLGATWDGRVMGRIFNGIPYGDGMNGSWEFSHWMPLPPPPTEGQEP